jgi:Glycosyl hydrolase family 1
MTATATGSPTAVRRRFPEGFYLTVMLEGRYTDAYLATAGDQTPRFTDEELATIASPLDFVGINVYRPGWYVEPSDQPPGYREIPINASHPKMASAWHVLDPGSCTGPRGRCSRSGGLGRSSSPRTAARPACRAGPNRPRSPFRPE